MDSIGNQSAAVISPCTGAALVAAELDPNVVVQVDGEQTINLTPGEETRRRSGGRTRRISAELVEHEYADAFSMNAMNIVFSRPMWSETQPKNGRVSHFRIRSIVAAKVSAVIVRPARVTGTVPTFRSSEIGARLAVHDETAGTDITT